MPEDQKTRRNNQLTDHGPEYTGPKYIKEGSSFQIKCLTNKLQNPQWTQIVANENKTKYIGSPSQSLPGDVRQEVFLDIIKATSDHAGNYTCHKFSQTYHEIIFINDIITNAEESEDAFIIHLQRKFQLHCNVTTTPEDIQPIGVEWYLNDERVVANERIQIWKNNSLFIQKALERDCGLYSCKVNVTDFDYNNTILVQSKPFLTASFKGLSVNKIEGETLRINCTAEGFPKPQIYWLKDNVNISDSNNTRYSIEGNQTLSYLNIIDLEESDRANYSCIAISPTGEISEFIFLRVKDKLAALWPFLGIIAEVAVLCTIIFIYEKRRAKQEFDESDTDQSPPDRKNVTDNTDVRQRKQ
uniref:Ig-like domain-containing protein n=1 Tax=Strigamia maritima TaxID=126957 RepID=T1J7C0_STRMM